MRNIIQIVLCALATTWVSCTGSKQGQAGSHTEDKQTAAFVSAFDADSAYRFVSEQVAFGPRVPGSRGHRDCGDWMVDKLRGWGYQIIEQGFNGKDYFGKPIQGRNIIATLAPEAPTRVLLMAHWDTRAVADYDPEHRRRSEPILGADDGGSGVGVLLELARQHALQHTGVELDFVFFDLEDGGSNGDNDSWCLGSQHWSKHPHQTDYRADFGILLDMVGAKKAKFYWEGYSKAYASPILYKVWEEARALGFGDYFVSANGGDMIDDHVPVIKNRGISSIDIINYNPHSHQGFGAHWHTHGDNMNIIDRKTLEAVGKTVHTMLRNRYSK
ncbi:MAG: M28 family peptidase [Porphyromonadaceae bacterium]|nr:M28 family peptidase [Porphyromonadaceae bacterium]